MMLALAFTIGLVAAAPGALLFDGDGAADVEVMSYPELRQWPVYGCAASGTPVQARLREMRGRSVYFVRWKGAYIDWHVRVGSDSPVGFCIPDGYRVLVMRAASLAPYWASRPAVEVAREWTEEE